MFQARSRINSANRAKKKYNDRHGAISIAARRYEKVNNK